MSDTHKKLFSHSLVTDSWRMQYESRGTGSLTMLSNSMFPFIRSGDQIVIKKTSPERIAAGDIITFKRGGIFVTHRVILKRMRGGRLFFLERGDRYSNASIHYVNAEAVIGLVMTIQRGSKSVAMGSFTVKCLNRLIGALFLGEVILNRLAASFVLLPQPFRGMLDKAGKRCIATCYKVLYSTYFLK